ncbi:condensation protein [Gordonia sp. PKS22-38]|uniref:Condensation protein n=1 Tax=Gordonia prachuapensis TaxID=3115651 RepID=A0ABU7MQ73_9ACTN|nr:condensation protein [Gordonia sp. PKS22-38]
MKLCDVGSVEIEPGALTRWQLCATAPAIPVPTPPSENEQFHLDAMRRNGSAGWLALTVELPGSVGIERLTASLRSLLDRHEVLRCHFVPDGDGYRRWRLDADSVGVEPIPATARDGGDTSPHTLTATCLTQIAAACTPFAPLGHYLAAVRRPMSTTVVLAFDHCFVDAYSLAVIASDLVDDLDGAAVDRPGSFLDIRAAEEAAPDVPADDPRLCKWGDFLGTNGWTVPEFPLDLGLGTGDTAEVHTAIRTLLDADDAAGFDDRVRAAGARTYPALLTAVADAVHRSGGPAELPTILPVHTRHSAADRRVVGWLVGNAPIRLSTNGDHDTAVRTNTARLGEALPLAHMGLTPVYSAFADLLRAARQDVFMMSYVDYRRLGLPPTVPVRQISSTRRTDAAQFWFWRDADGIHLRARYPHTVRALHTMTDVLGLVTDRLHAGACAPSQLDCG